MNPLAVEPDLARPQDFLAHERVTRERVEALGMIRLIQRQLQVDGLVVQRDVGEVRAGQPGHADLSHPKVGRDDVFTSRAGENGLDLIEKWVFQRPEPHRLHGDFQLDVLAAPGDGRLHGAAGAVLGLELNREAHGLRRGLIQRRLDGDFAGVDVRQELHRLQRGPGPGLQVDRLPDALGGSIALFAFELESVGRVVDAQHEGLFVAPLDLLGQLEFEGGVSALEAADLLTVEPSGRQPVASADHHEDLAAFPFRRHANRPLVPGDVGLALHAGQFRTPRERHVDRKRKLRLARCPVAAQPRVLFVEAEVPRPVEIHPLGSLEVGPRMLRQRDVLCLGKTAPGSAENRRDHYGDRRYRSADVSHRDYPFKTGLHDLPQEAYEYRTGASVICPHVLPA